MRVSAKVDYALRATAELAAAEPGRPIKGERLAQAQEIPLKFLENILVDLRHAGIVASQRGETTAGPCGGGSEGRTCPTGFDTTSNAWIQTRDSGGNPSDHAFYVAVFG